MKYILVVRGQVVWGPIEWNRRIFENELREEADITTSLPDFKNDTAQIPFEDGVRIMAVGDIDIPSYHALAESLEGPFWNLGGDVATAYFKKKTLPLEQSKPNYKLVVSDLRWQQESSTVSVNIRGTTVSVSTARGERDQWNALYAVGIPKTWKFGEQWLDLEVEDFKTVASAIHDYIQPLYDEERRLYGLIDSAATLQDLIDIENDPTLKKWDINGKHGI